MHNLSLGVVATPTANMSSAPGRSPSREKASKCDTDTTIMFVCPICNRNSVRMKRCARCLEMSYCSLECQKKDWKMHKKVCFIDAEYIEEMSRRPRIDFTPDTPLVFHFDERFSGIYTRDEFTPGETTHNFIELLQARVGVLAPLPARVFMYQILYTMLTRTAQLHRDLYISIHETSITFSATPCSGARRMRRPTKDKIKRVAVTFHCESYGFEEDRPRPNKIQHLAPQGNPEVTFTRQCALWTVEDLCAIGREAATTVPLVREGMALPQLTEEQLLCTKAVIRDRYESAAPLIWDDLRLHRERALSHARERQRAQAGTARSPAGVPGSCIGRSSP